MMIVEYQAQIVPDQTCPVLRKRHLFFRHI